MLMIIIPGNYFAIISQLKVALSNHLQTRDLGNLNYLLGI